MERGWIKLSKYCKNAQNRKIYHAKCLQCGKVFTNHRSMNSHLKICPKTLNKNQGLITQFLKTDDDNDEKMDLTPYQIDLIELFASSNLSINQINNYNFKKIFLNLGVKEKDIPNSEDFKKMIINYSNELFKKNLELFENKNVSLIFDGSTSWNRNFYQFSIFYPGIVRHYGLFNIYDTSADSIKRILINIIENLKRKNINVFGITTDNASNLVSCFNKIKEDVEKGETLFPLIRFACSAHTAQLIINDLKKESAEFKNFLEKLVKFWRFIKKRSIFNKYKELGIPNSPPHFQTTRWNSLYNCISYLLENFDFFHETQESFPNIPIFFNDNLREIMKSLAIVLCPVINFTNKVQRNFVTAGDSFCFLLELENDIDSIEIPDSFGFHDIIRRKMAERFTNTCDSTLAELCFLLTPRGRDWFIKKNEIANQTIGKIERNENVSDVENNNLEMFNIEKSLITDKIIEISNYFHMNGEDNVNVFFNWVFANDRYLVDPISYWKTKITDKIFTSTGTLAMKELSQIALRILSLPASEAICERCFSQLKLTHSHLRTNLKTDLLDALLRIKLNLIWSQEKPFSDLETSSEDESQYSDVSSD